MDVRGDQRKCSDAELLAAHVAGDRDAFAGDIYPMTLDNLTKWVYDAPGRKPHGDLVGWMPNFSAAGMTQADADQIAKFLLCDTATNPSSHPECR